MLPIGLYVSGFWPSDTNIYQYIIRYMTVPLILILLPIPRFKTLNLTQVLGQLYSLKQMNWVNRKSHITVVFYISRVKSILFLRLLDLCSYARLRVNLKQLTKWRSPSSLTCWMENGSFYIQHLNQFCRLRSPGMLFYDFLLRILSIFWN